MNQNAEAITILCSYLCAGKDVKPLWPVEWSKLAQWLLQHNLEPKDILEFGREDFIDVMSCTSQQADRMLRLIGRSASLSFELNRYETLGINVVTRADAVYPKRLKHVLGNTCPPILYCAGDLKLLEQPCAGYVGSRAVQEEDLDFTAQAVRKTFDQGFGVVSGGARGTDTAAQTEILHLGGWAVAYIADSMMRRLRSKDVSQSVQDGQLLLLSAVKPNANFSVGAAMGRNRFIYAQSQGTVVVRSDLGRGGTWTGATECLTHGWSPVFCWNNPAYPGNLALIDKGAVPIDAGWDGNMQLSASQDKHRKDKPHTSDSAPDTPADSSMKCTRKQSPAASVPSQQDGMSACESALESLPKEEEDMAASPATNVAFAQEDAAIVCTPSVLIAGESANGTGEPQRSAPEDRAGSSQIMHAPDSVYTQLSFFEVPPTDWSAPS